MLYFFDSSALIKLYHNEEGTAVVQKLFEDKKADNCISQLTFTEFFSAFYKKLRTKEIKEERIVQEAVRSFEIDMQYEWVIQLDDFIFQEARNLIIKYGATYSLRTLDALQLACANTIASLEKTIFITADADLGKLAHEMGFEVILPR